MSLNDDEKPLIVCLCGSTRFSDAFQKANLEETLAGRIVLSIGCDMRSDGDLFASMTDAERAAVKARLDELHLRKIDMADEVLILNVGGYIGDSTRRELLYALAHNKLVRYLEPPETCPLCGNVHLIGRQFGRHDEHVVAACEECRWNGVIA